MHTNLSYLLDNEGLKNNDSRELGNLKLLNSEVSLAFFKQYLYTGKLKDIEKNENVEDLLLDLIMLASQFEIYDLEYAVTNYLESIISIENVCHIFNLSQNSTLHEFCLMFMDFHAIQIIEQNKYRELSTERIVELFSRDSFDVKETTIFTAVKDWHKYNNLSYIQSVVDCIRFQFIEERFIKSSEVKNSGMLTLEEYSEVLRNQSANTTNSFRGTLSVDTNLALYEQGAVLIEGEEYNHGLLDNEDNDFKEYLFEKEAYTWHSISEDNNKSILIELERTFIINHIALHLWDFNERYDNTVRIFMQNTCFRWSNLFTFTVFHQLVFVFYWSVAGQKDMGSSRRLQELLLPIMAKSSL